VHKCSPLGACLFCIYAGRDLSNRWELRATRVRDRPEMDDARCIDIRKHVRVVGRPELGEPALGAPLVLNGETLGSIVNGVD
jgi:hypothetical protein